MSEYITELYWDERRNAPNQAQREEIVRCRDCKHYCASTVDEDGEGEPSWCTYWGHEWLRDDGFCAWGERRVDA